MNKHVLLDFFLVAALWACSQLTVQAQKIPKALQIQLSYEKPDRYLETAIETIEATNTVAKGNNVTYQAGNSVTLLPGFQTQAGGVFSAIVQEVVESEAKFALQAYPSPFDRSTTIIYYLPNDSKVNLWVSDIQGKVISQLVKDENQSAGQHTLEWTPTSLTDGVYIPILEANQRRVISRIIKK